MEYFRGFIKPRSNEVTTWYLRKRALARFSRFSSFIVLCDLSVGARAVVLALFDFAKGVNSGSADPTKWLV